VRKSVKSNGDEASWCVVEEKESDAFATAAKGANAYELKCVVRLKADVLPDSTHGTPLEPRELAFQGFPREENGLSFQQASAANAEFQRQLTLADVDSIGKCLVHAVNALGGTCLRPGGGLYFIPPASLERWEAVKAAVNACRPNEVYVLRPPLDEGACRAIVRAFTENVVERSKGIAEEVAQGKLKARALASRRVELAEVTRRLEEYEGILDRPLADAREALAAVKFGVATGNLLAAAGLEECHEL
jgi:hypothetical protein